MSDDDSSSLGKRKRTQSKKARAWCFTLFHAALDTALPSLRSAIAELLCATAIKSSSYLHYGIETCPASGREHLQGIVEAVFVELIVDIISYI